MGRIKPIYSRACILILALPDIFASGTWIYLWSPVAKAPSLIGSAYLLMLLWICISAVTGMYNPMQLVSWRRMSLVICKALLAQLFVGGILCYILDLWGADMNSFLFFSLWLAAVACASRLVLLAVYRWQSAIAENCKRYIILGYTAEGKLLQKHLKTLGKHHQFLGYFDDYQQGTYVRGGMAGVQDFCREHAVNTIYVCGDATPNINGLFDFASQQFIYLYCLGPVLRPQNRHVDHIDLEDGLSLLGYQPHYRKQWTTKWLQMRIIKRKLVATSQ